MSKHSTLKSGSSLFERAAEVYDFEAEFQRRSAPEPQPRVEPAPPPAPKPEAARPAPEPAAPRPQPAAEPAPSRPRAEPQGRALQIARQGRSAKVDREALRTGSFIVPNAPVTGLAEEFRIIKRQLLLGVNGRTGIPAEKSRSILICSAHPDEGKTFCAVNLALSLATERDVEVLLVDGDFAKPEIMSILGIEDGPGLIDAIVDPLADANDFVIETDIKGLSVLPSGRQANNATELLASSRARSLIAGLTRGYPKRVLVFDSPPALMASPASVMATWVGQLCLVVRADHTTETDLREAVALLSGCDEISLMLNRADAAASGRRFGYYGYGE